MSNVNGMTIGEHCDRCDRLHMDNLRLRRYVDQWAERCRQVEREKTDLRQRLDGGEPGAVEAERARIRAAIDRIHHEHYLHGMRCSDFKEALDMVRAALEGG